jgi:FixJ family two-component response regulator
MPLALLVDDLPAVRNLVACVLGEVGYAVESFGDARSAIAAFAADPDRFDVVVSDVILGDNMTGIDVAHEVLALRPNKPLVLVSGFDVSIEGAVIPNIAFLHKPFTSKELTDALASVTQETRQATETNEA